jgi:hypothetical protein
MDGLELGVGYGGLGDGWEVGRVHETDEIL